MKKFALVIVALAMMFPAALFARDVAPIVSTDWLEKNLNNAKVKIIDIRKVEEYKEGHVPGAINVFYGTWAVKKGELQNELPSNDDLADVIKDAGIATDSAVVVVGKTDTPVELGNSSRVAWTLRYAGVKEVGILDGGYNKWTKEKKPVSQEAAVAKESDFKAAFSKNIFADKAYVRKNMKTVRVVDVRNPDFFFGVSKLDFVAKPGHIKGSVNLPTSFIYTKDGMFKPAEDLQAMATNVLGNDKTKETILYCDTGRLATGWWFVLADVLGYKNVKSYDGSSEDWMKDADAPIVKYSWK